MTVGSIQVTSLFCWISLVQSTNHLNRECCLSEYGDCPIWNYNEGKNCKGNCTFSVFNPVISKSEDCLKQANRSTVQLQLGYCMTFAEMERKANTVACPYNTAQGHEDLVCTHSLTINATSYLELNSFMCSKLNRVEKHCQRCNSSFGQSVYTLDLSCHSCSNSYSGWCLYLFLELTSLSLFLIVLLALQVSPTNANIKAFVLFCQLNTIFLNFGSESLLEHTFGRSSVTFVLILKTLYGFWNFDFLRSVIPSFCVDPNLNNLDVLTLQYLSVIYPMIFIVLAWFSVDLHERGFRPIVTLWKPFRRYLSHFSVTNDPKRSIVSFLATVVILSYTKVIYIAVTLTSTVNVVSLCGEKSRVLYLQPDIPIYSVKHAPYVVVSVVMVLLYIALPLLLLILYSMQSVRQQLNSHCINSHNIQMFVETFYSCYKDGSNNTQNTRLFSTAYLFFRIFVVLCFVKSPSLLISFLLVSIMHGLAFALLCIVKPYKNLAYTFLDALLFFAFLISSAFSIAITVSNNQDYNIFLCTVIYIAMGSPIFYLCARVSRWVIMWLAGVNFRSILMWTRRGYEDIGGYESEQLPSLMENCSQHHHQGNGKIE